MFLLFISLFSFAFSQGTSTEGLRLPEKEDLKPYEYEAVDLIFWRRIEKNLTEKNYLELIYQSIETQKIFEPTSPEFAEAKLGIAIGLYKMNFVYGAMQIFMELAKDRIGTHISYMSLNYLDEISQSIDIDHVDLWENFLNSYEFGELPEKIQSFVSFHKAIYNSAFGFDKWADVDFKKIHKKSFWYYHWIYLSAIANINQDQAEKALNLFRTINDDENSPQPIRDKARKQIARLIFEEGQFDKSLELYDSLQLDIREKGRILLERAWAMYYIKDYSHALGMLSALEAPYFDAALHYESYILQMIIYKQLCHYETVISTAKTFNQRFDKSIKAIHMRSDFHQDPTIARMALMDYSIQPQANFVDRIQKELEELRNYNWNSYDFYQTMLVNYEAKIKEIKFRLQPIIEHKSALIAEEILDAKEQVDFLEYSAQLDALRISRMGENRNYSSEKINFIRFDTIFWLFRGEFWVDELPDFRVLISSKCSLPTGILNESQSEEETWIEEPDF